MFCFIESVCADRAMITKSQLPIFKQNKKIKYIYGIITCNSFETCHLNESICPFRNNNLQ